ncbi:MAG: glycosyltransferase family 4 protein [Chitinophagales bacterium]|nr:glycosyltransferase family 4 protein [Chitinophagales bacterium]
MLPRRIAVNTRFLLKDKMEGIGWFSYETLKRICATHPDIEFHFLFDRSYHEEFIFSPNIVPHVVMPQARHPILWKWWFEISIPTALKNIQPDIFFSPDGYLSLKSKVPTVMVIHDLAFEHYPEFVSKTAARFYKQNVPKYAEKARRIATVSEFSKRDIHEKYDVPLDKIDVVYNGASHVFRPFNDHEKTLVKQTHTNGKEFFLYTGAIHPRKNIRRLLLSFDAFKEQTGSNMKLVLAGRQAWMYEDILEAYKEMNHRVDVIMKGHVDQSLLADLVGSATALVYVSLFEGFGIPIVEAMQADTPVITSDTSSMTEIGGDAALLIDPYSIDEIVAAMKKITTDETTRMELTEKMRIQRLKFSWNLTSEKLWSCILKASEDLVF